MSNQATALYPFVPSGSRYDEAMRFLGELGFQPIWQAGGYAGMKFGQAYFILQDIDAPEWQKMQMVTYEVPDLEAYWQVLQAKDLATNFPGARVNPPKDFPWGREIHILDPGGVCWHVRQSTV